MVVYRRVDRGAGVRGGAGSRESRGGKWGEKPGGGGKWREKGREVGREGEGSRDWIPPCPPTL